MFSSIAVDIATSVKFLFVWAHKSYINVNSNSFYSQMKVYKTDKHECNGNELNRLNTLRFKSGQSSVNGDRDPALRRPG